ncbi:MAG: HNH endonuclease [Deltaproteobacteria bacterium]|nr:HNH endonuclease [Deltaproteobacteria bacterium]
MLSSAVLVLNRSFFPVHVTTVRRAFVMLYQGLAKAVDREYQTFTFASWSDLAASADDETVGLINRMIRVPRVVLLTVYDRIPKRAIRFSRLNLMMRDRYQCQYCGRQTAAHELNLDHVIPRSRGGLTTWENIVTSCHHCNRHKGGRTPDEAHMHLIRRPYRPTSLPFLHLHLKQFRYDEWKPYLNVVDFSYWNVELLP